MNELRLEPSLKTPIQLLPDEPRRENIRTDPTNEVVYFEHAYHDAVTREREAKVERDLKQLEYNDTSDWWFWTLMAVVPLGWPFLLLRGGQAVIGVDKPWPPTPSESFERSELIPAQKSYEEAVAYRKTQQRALENARRLAGASEGETPVGTGGLTRPKTTIRPWSTTERSTGSGAGADPLNSAVGVGASRTNGSVGIASDPLNGAVGVGASRTNGSSWVSASQNHTQIRDLLDGVGDHIAIQLNEGASPGDKAAALASARTQLAEAERRALAMDPLNNPYQDEIAQHKTMIAIFRTPSAPKAPVTSEVTTSPVPVVPSNITRLTDEERNGLREEFRAVRRAIDDSYRSRWVEDKYVMRTTQEKAEALDSAEQALRGVQAEVNTMTPGNERALRQRYIAELQSEIEVRRKSLRASSEMLPLSK